MTGVTAQRHFISISLLLLLSACSTLPGIKPLPPEVEVDSVDIIKFGFLSQELAFTLDVFNPNGFDLPVNLLEFVATVDQQVVADGRSDKAVLLRASSNTQVTVNVTTQASQLLSKFVQSSALADGGLDYNVTGFVKLDNWPKRIPFNIDKTYSLDGS